MKKIIFSIALASSFSVCAEINPVLEFSDEGEFILDIPFIQIGDEYYSAELNAQPSLSALTFEVDDESVEQLLNPDDGACSKTTQALFLACRAELREDLLVHQANCFNLADADEQAECLEETAEIQEELSEECEATQDSRTMLCGVFGEAAYDPEIDPENFMTTEQIQNSPNAYFPLSYGNTWVYQSDEQTVTVTVTTEQMSILDIPVIVVHDQEVDHDGNILENTYDYYAMDLEGNVWYFGETSVSYPGPDEVDEELPSYDGSFRPGVEGAKAGILVRKNPVIDEYHRQEYFLDEAEDISKTIALNVGHQTANFNCANSCLQTLEFTPLEPGAEETKYWLPGVGMIQAVSHEDGSEENLVSFTAGT